MNALASLGRVLTSAIVAAAMTAGSFAIVVWMNADPAPPRHERDAGPRRTFALEAPPPPLDPRPLPDASTTVRGEAEAATADVSAPTPAPPLTARLAPSLGPGSLPIGTSEALPSMGALPNAELPRVEEKAPQTPARPRTRPAPRYPALAQRRGLEGVVTLRLRVDESGRVTDAVVTEADPAGVFEEAALRAARQYKFSPARQGNRPIPSTLQQTIRFELQQ